MKQRLLIVAALLAISCAPAIFAEIGAERPVSTPVYRPVTSVAAEAIASDGKQFMAVWTDGRSWLNGCCGVYASRIATDGTVLDPQGISLGLGHGATGIAWNGASYVVVFFYDNGVSAASLSPEGRIEIPRFTLLKSARISTQSQVIASNGSVTIVTADRAWLVLDARLQVLETHSLSGASVYRSGDGFTLIANSGIIRLDSSGHQIQTATSAASGSAIGCHKEQCIQVYPDAQTKHLTVASFDPVTQTSGKPVELPITNGPFSLVVISDGYLLVTNDNSMQRLDAQGLPAGAAVPPCCRGAASIAAASDGVIVAVLRKVDSTLSVTMVTPTGNREPRTVARSASSQYWPAITSSGSNYLVAWWETDGSYFGRVALDGTILDDGGKQLTHNGAGDSTTDVPSVPSVVFDGTSYIVATSMKYSENWYVDLSKPAPITISRIDAATGMLLNVHTTCGTAMRLARNENTTVAVWLDCSGNLDIAYVDGTGALLPAPITLALNPLVYYWNPFLANPRMAWNGSAWLVTWEEQGFFCDNGPFRCRLFTITLKGMLVSENLTPVSVAFLWPASGYYPSSSRVASNGHDFLVLADGPGVRHLSASGMPLDTFKKLPFSWPRDMVWDGVNYSVAHLEYPLDQYLGSHLAITRFLLSGEAAGTAVINANPPGYDSYASLFSLGNGKVISAYTRFAPEPLYGEVERVFFTLPDKPRKRAVSSTRP
ncbi:MAG: hypothetical protein QOK37_1822 [Thermoanaerobaculia bacterium]|nr:hypothetical protein [Thermoanaerobaculia bacterium]